MPRYIDADELTERLKDQIWVARADLILSCGTVMLTPTADVAEVKRGRWIRTDAYPHRIYCSNCYGTYALDHWGIWIDGSLPRVYCPNCGSRMDLDGDTE